MLFDIKFPPPQFIKNQISLIRFVCTEYQKIFIVQIDEILSKKNKKG